MNSRPPEPSRREVVANALGCIAIVVVSASLVLLALVGLVELVRWLA